METMATLRAQLEALKNGNKEETADFRALTEVLQRLEELRLQVSQLDVDARSVLHTLDRIGVGAPSKAREGRLLSGVPEFDQWRRAHQHDLNAAAWGLVAGVPELLDSMTAALEEGFEWTDARRKLFVAGFIVRPGNQQASMWCYEI